MRFLLTLALIFSLVVSPCVSRADSIPSRDLTFDELNDMQEVTGHYNKGATGTTPVVIQAASAANNSGSTLDVTATFGSSVGAGHSVIIFAQTGASSPTFTGSTATDGASDTFTLLAQVNDATNGQFGGMWVICSSAGGFTTATAKFSTVAGAFSTMTAYEVSGLAASCSDTGATNVVGTGSAATNGDTSGSFTASQTGELIVAGFFQDGGATSTAWTAGTSPIAFTIPSGGNTSLGGNNPHALEYAVWTGSGSVNPTITLGTTGSYLAIGWGFKHA
jgi:hypothetical protein